MSSLPLFAQADVAGIYFRFENDPVASVEDNEYKQVIASIETITLGGYEIDSPFNGAHRTSLSWYRLIRVDNTANYPAVLNALENSNIFDAVFTTSDDIIVNGIESSSITPVQEVMPDAPECSNPLLPNDPGLFDGDYMYNMQMPCAWSVTRGSSDITVGVVDHYFDTNNSELQGKITNSPTCTPNVNTDGQYGSLGTSEGNIRDRVTKRHGTSMMVGVAGVADNNLCVAGTGGNTVVNGYCTRPNINAPRSTLSAVMRAVNDGMPVISVSVHDQSFWDSYQPGSAAAIQIRDVFEEAVDRGSFVTFAVRSNNAQYLQDIDGVMLVGFGYERGGYFPYNESNMPDDSPFEIVLPTSGAQRMEGPALCSSGVGGSSLGAAYLAGIAGLMLDVNRCLTPEAIEEIIYETSNDVPNRFCCFPDRFEVGKGKINAYQAVLAAQNYNGEQELVVANGDVHLIEDVRVRYNNIRVETGGVLKIFESKVSIEGNNTGPYQNGRIEIERGAKLIVSNSTLTSSSTTNLCDNKRWSGIRVHGNTDLPQPNMYDAAGILQVNTQLAPDEAGVVILLQRTVVENATNAVATSVPGYPYPEQVARWGGLIIADDVVFKNNFRAVEFLQYPDPRSGNTFMNKSTFNACEFITEDPNDDRSLGITLWSTNGVKITRSTFRNIGRESVLTIDGSFVVKDGNNFINTNERSNHRHIAAMSTHPWGSYAEIGAYEQPTLPSNKFDTRDKDDVFIYSDGSDELRGVDIIDNDFNFLGPESDRNGAPAGIEIIGSHNFYISGNRFISSRKPVVLDNTGQTGAVRPNSINCNTFDNINGPLLFTNNNIGTQVRQNAFKGSPGFGQIAYNLSWSGSYDARQGSEDNPANNSFENTGTQQDINNTGSGMFRYFYTDDGSGNVNVLEPKGASTGYVKELTFNEAANVCGSQGVPPDIQGSNTPGDINTVRTQMIKLEVYIANNPTDTSAIFEHQEVASELGQRVNQYVSVTVARNEIDSAVSLLNSLNTASGDMLSFGVLTSAGRYVEARQKLPVINSYGSEYNEFVYVQNINIDRLTSDKSEYKLKPGVKNELTKYAGGSSRFRGYSRALLLLLEDDRFYDQWYSSPVKSFESVGTDQEVEIDQLNFVNVYPNPSGGMFQIEGKQLASVSRIDVLDPAGRTIMTVDVKGRTSVELNLAGRKGMCSLLFYGDKQIISQKVLIK